MADASLMVNEIFHSIQGESTWAGLACTFVRLTGCHLRCGYCDTEYAFHEGQRMGLDEIINQVDRLSSRSPAGSSLNAQDTSDIRHSTSPVAQITGGEPLLQPNVHPLMTALCDRGYTLLIETSGACDLSPCDPRVIRIMDFKTPGSGEVERNDWNNIDHLNAADEVKFVLTSRADYEWARGVIEKYGLPARVNSVLLSAVHEMPRGNELPGCTGMSLIDLAEWVLTDGLPVRVQTQLHKIIWDPTRRGV